MAKSINLRKMDTKDRRILFQLDTNSRQSDSEIAKKVGLSKEVVNYRIKRFVNLGIVKGFYTMVDFSKLGYKDVRVYMKFQETSLEIEKEIFDYMINMTNSFEVIKADGNWDAVLTILVKDLKNFFFIFDQFQEKYKKYISEKNISLFVKYIHHPKGYLYPPDYKEAKPRVAGASEEVKADKTDLKILSVLVSNSRASLMDISKKLNLTPEAIKHRIKQLEKKQVILSYRALFSLEKLGYQFYKVDIELKNVKIKKALGEVARQHPNIVAEDITIGGSDFECDVEADSHNDFIKILEEIRNQFRDDIRTIKYYTARKYHKLVYIPTKLEEL